MDVRVYVRGDVGVKGGLRVKESLGMEMGDKKVKKLGGSE